MSTFASLRAHLGRALLLTSVAVGPACSSDEGGDDDKALKAADKTWTWFDIEGSFCRDGSPAGIAVSLNEASSDLMIFFEGGGACYDALTCGTNPANIMRPVAEQRRGVFDRDNPDNPVRDWNLVYVPYCTGDTHAGVNANGMANGQKQMFVGYTNTAAFLERIKATLPDPERVLVTGISAGGFGASANAPQILRTFPDAEGHLIDDSGPALSASYLAPCLQKLWRDQWGLDQTMLRECGADCPNRDDFISDFGLHLAKTYAQHKSGLIEATSDFVIRSFFGVGINECSGSLLTPVPADQFQQGLLEFRERMQPYPNFGTYYPASTQHTWLSTDSLYTAMIGEVRLVDWVRDIVNDTSAPHVGP